MSSAYSLICSRDDARGPFKVIEFIPDSPEFEDKDWSEFSSGMADAIYLAEQENVGFFHYEHWQNGSLARRLKYNDDYFWLAADGEPELWEKELLFSPANLEIILKSNDCDRDADIRSYWEKGRVQAEDSFPIIVGPINIIKIINDFWNLPKDF